MPAALLGYGGAGSPVRNLQRARDLLLRLGVVLACREVNGGREACRAVEYSSAGYAPGFAGPPQQATNPSR